MLSLQNVRKSTSQLYSSCPICGSDAGSDHIRKHGYQIKVCQSCTALYVSPRPSVDEIHQFYNQPTYYANSDLGYSNYVATERHIREEARHRLKVIASLSSQRGSLLDLGCAAGFFLDEARRDNWSVAGTELAHSMRQFANEHFGIYVSKDGTEFQQNVFDVVTMWEYIEHMIDPLAELKRAYNMLSPNGIVCLSTPNTAHFQAVHAPEDWWEFKPPAHLTFFTVETLTRAVELAGYTILRVDVHTPILPVSGNLLFSSLRQLQLLLGDRLQRRTPFWGGYSIARRVAIPISRRFISKAQLCVGIDLYARKLV